MKKLIAIAVFGLMSVGAFAQDTTKVSPKLPETVFQDNMTIVKDKDAKTLVMTFKVSKTFNNADIESVKCYVQHYYSREGYNGWTPQLSHKGDDWTFIFNK